MHPKQEQILKFIEDNPRPTIREIRDGLGFSSTSVTAHHVRKLQAAGHITWNGKARSIELADAVTLTFTGDDALRVRGVSTARIAKLCSLDKTRDALLGPEKERRTGHG